MKRIVRGRPSPEQVSLLLMLLDEHYGDSSCSLTHEDPYQLLVSTILSAQCTDARVNMVTPALFEACPTPAELDTIPVAKLERLIKSTGFFRNKAKSLKGAARMLVSEMAGKVPNDLDQLLRLPGVARKTANVVLGSAFGITSGVVVDTHVGRITNRLGLTRQTDPKKIEQDLMRILPKPHWIRFAHQMIDHGRAICLARSPRCDACFLADLCAFAGRLTKAPPKKSVPRRTSKRKGRAAIRAV
jgi:endonuclease III